MSIECFPEMRDVGIHHFAKEYRHSFSQAVDVISKSGLCDSESGRLYLHLLQTIGKIPWDREPIDTIIALGAPVSPLYTEGDASLYGCYFPRSVHEWTGDPRLIYANGDIRAKASAKLRMIHHKAHGTFPQVCTTGGMQCGYPDISGEITLSRSDELACRVKDFDLQFGTKGGETCSIGAFDHGSTRGNFRDIQSYYYNTNDKKSKKIMVVITSLFQIPRSHIIMASDASMQDLLKNNRAFLVGAESLCDGIKELDDPMRYRIEKEIEGISALMGNTYSVGGVQSQGWSYVYQE